MTFFSSRENNLRINILRVRFRKEYAIASTGELFFVAYVIFCHCDTRKSEKEKESVVVYINGTSGSSTIKRIDVKVIDTHTQIVNS